MTAEPEAQILEREQAYLERARASLAAMRDATVALRVNAGNAYTGEMVEQLLGARIASMNDDPAVPLFFGRIDAPAQSLHIGRRHILDREGDPVVIDWRADAARPFYNATADDPHGIALRRRFGFDAGSLTAFEDERLDLGQQLLGSASELLRAEIERPRHGPMRDIVATIQPEQDAIVRAPLEQSICVQGGPGTGKTAIGLHRAAYLLYTYRGQLQRSGVLIIGPNRAFLGYIAAVLPALGEVDVAQTTTADLFSRARVRGRDDASTAALKGDLRLAEVMSRALWRQISKPDTDLVVSRNNRRWRFPAHDMMRALDDTRRRGLSYEAARQALADVAARAVVGRMEDEGLAPGDREVSAVRRSPDLVTWLASYWPQADPVRILVQLWSDPEWLRRCSTGILTDAERELLHWPELPPSPGRARFSAADLVLLDELGCLIDRERPFGHVIIDEAQDLSPMALRAVGRRAAGGSVTVLGDLAQGTAPWSPADWGEVIGALGTESTSQVELEIGYRVPETALRFASRLLPLIAPGLRAARSTRDTPDALTIHRSDQLIATIAAELERLRAVPGSCAVICADSALRDLVRGLRRKGIEATVIDPDHEAAAERAVVVVPASICKGLEFDSVIVAEPAAIVADDLVGLRLLYVALTRAVSRLVVVHQWELPEPLLASTQ